MRELVREVIGHCDMGKISVNDKISIKNVKERGKMDMKNFRHEFPSKA